MCHSFGELGHRQRGPWWGRPGPLSPFRVPMRRSSSTERRSRNDAASREESVRACVLCGKPQASAPFASSARAHASVRTRNRKERDGGCGGSAAAACPPGSSRRRHRCQGASPHGRGDGGCGGCPLRKRPPHAVAIVSPTMAAAPPATGQRRRRHRQPASPGVSCLLAWLLACLPAWRP